MLRTTTRQRYIVGFVLVFVGVFTSFVPTQVPTSGVGLWTYWLPYVGYFILGTVLRNDGRGLSRWRWAAPVFLVSSILGAGFTLLWVHEGGLQAGLGLYDYLSPTTVPASLAAFTMLTTSRPGARRSVWSTRPARLVSECSLGIYLIHPIYFTEEQIYGWHPGTTFWGSVEWVLGSVCVIFVLALASAMLLRKIPILRRVV